MKMSEGGIKFLIQEEGERLKAYKCAAGVWTIGVGHTGADVKEGMVITKEKSRELLKADLSRFEKAVNTYIKVPLEQHQFDALISLAFNIGVGNFSKSTLVKKINANATIEEIEFQFKQWRLAGGKPILLPRRKREARLYKGGRYE
ncbi:lysozyme [Fusobacterium ulcerans]|uniref:lysozyme n=1 Tax=Fusobacterium ulcerans TaxID=861 RepID=UPI00103086AE|nr:lysozyme [Fusobacterium ulcerans]